MIFKPKNHLVQLERKRVAKYRDTQQGLYLDRNERVTDFPAETVDTLFSQLKEIPVNLYPDVDQFYRKLGDWLEVDPDRLYVTEGVSGAIKALFETLTYPGDTAVFPLPTFALYPVYAKMHQNDFRTVGYTDTYELEISKLYDRIDAGTTLVFIPNPNVPIEGTVGLEVLTEIAEKCLACEAYLVVDEVYYPFGGPDANSLTEKFENVLVMRSFSKAFGLAGIRTGFIVGNPSLIDYVSKTRTGYESNSVSMAIASFFIDNYPVIESYIEDVKEGFEFLKSRLDHCGVEYNGGNASNFIFVNLHDSEKANRVVNDLKKQKIFIRGNWPEPYTGGFSITGAPLVEIRKLVGRLEPLLLSV